MVTPRKRMITDSEQEGKKSPNRSNTEKPQMLLIGIPEADPSYWTMNIAQAPQGPTLRESLPVPDFIRRKINSHLRYVYNPSKNAPYVGMHLIKQNLENDIKGGIDITLIDYPTEKEIMRLVQKVSFKVIGIGIGCENKVHEGKFLARRIKHHSKNKEVAIVFGNYGATTGKKLGILTEADGTVLKDNPEEIEAKEKSGEYPYTGEGVQSMRAFLLNNREKLGLELKVKPNAPMVSYPVPDPDLPPSNGFLRWLAVKMGFFGTPKDMNKLAVSLGCVNNCSFCNTAKNFGDKTLLYTEAKEMYQAMKKQIDINEARKDYVPETLFFLMDENFMRPLANTEELCRLVEESGKNIRWGTFGDIKGLLEYKKKYQNFRGLVRGGMLSIWIGLESKADVFKKRGGASIDEVETIIRELQDLGILVFGSFIPGLSIHTEGETRVVKDEYEIKKKLIKKNNLNETQLRRAVDAEVAARKNKGQYDLLNIWEDIQWWLKQNTAANQVMMLTDTRLVNPLTEEPILDLSDEEFGHTFRRDTHPNISGKRLEEIDKEARNLFYRENGPVALRTVLTMWDGYKKLKDSDDPAEVIATTYYYWLVKRSFQAISLSLALFSETLFEKCSRTFLNRLAQFLDDFEQSTPPKNDLSDEYQRVFNKDARVVSKTAQWCAARLRTHFIRKHLNKDRDEVSQIDLLDRPIPVPNET